MKLSKKLFSVFLACFLAMLCSFACFDVGAVTVYTVNGIKYSIKSETQAAVYSCVELKPEVEIPLRADSRVVIGVDERAFYKNSVVKSVVLPDTVSVVGDWAFAYCDNLTSINIPKSFSTAGSYSFAFCPNLESVDLSGSVIKALAPAMFQGSGLRKVDIPFTVTALDRDVFNSCKNLEYAYIPGSVEKLGIRVFLGCDKLETVEFSPSCKVRNITEKMFRNCPSLKNVNIPDSVTSIDALAFNNCTALEKLIIGDGVTSIADDAFDGADNLTIYCTRDSYARTFAEQKGIPYILTDCQIGDVDHDGYVNIMDATAILKHIVDIEHLSDESLAVADVDKDGFVMVTDATMIQKMIAEII